MIIVADENMPMAEAAFSTIGEVRLRPGRAITRDALRGAEVLAVRSVTEVNADLLEGTPVRFVGTATIGVDHVDRDYLARREIGFSSAPGCNANSVAEYVAAALLTLADRRGEALAGKTLGVIGCGNVGSRVAAKAEALGMRVLRNDPPLARETGDAVYRPIDELFAADFVTVHVPLTREGEDATWHLVNADFLDRMGPEATLLNSSRGAVVDTSALRDALERGALRDAVLDVWEGEPNIDFGLLDRVALGTPHIAGYSYDGKLNGTQMVYEAACRCLGLDATIDVRAIGPAPDKPELTLTAAGRPEQEVIREAVRELYDIEADDRRLRAAAALPAERRGPRFDELRKTYPVRREFPNTRLRLAGASPTLTRTLAALGFKL